MMIIYSLIFINTIKEFLSDLVYFQFSIITIKINKRGKENIYFTGDICYGGSTKFDLPDEVFINDIPTKVVSDLYDLENEENIIQLKWNEPRENWGCLFLNCENIVEIDFSQFDFSQNIYGNQMFSNCKLVSSLNINDFGIVKLKNAHNFFNGMTFLTSIKLSNFDVSESKDINGMFRGCSSLTSLDLSNFQTDNLSGDVNSLFVGCSKLEYINLKNAKFNPSYQFNFISSRINLVFCSEDDRIINKIKQEVECAVLDCSDNWRKNQKKLTDNNQCVDGDCIRTNYPYNYNNICYQKCPSGTYNNNYKCEDCHNDCKTCEKSADEYNTNCLSCKDPNKYLKFLNCVSNCPNGIDNDESNNNIRICKCDLIKCHKCNGESLNLNLCISCNEGYYPKYDDKNNDYIDCYESIEGYYLESRYFKSCYESCQICDKSGNNINHNCIQCKNNFNYELNINSYKNCYTYDEYEQKILNNKSFQELIDDIINSYLPENGNVFEIAKPDGIIYQITNSINELELLKNKSITLFNNNISIIDLGQCETILRQEYHINDNDSLIFVKNEKLTNKASEKNLSFEVYEPYNKDKLNISICEDIPINIYIPMELSEETKQLYNQIKESGYDMFNINDPFYQDICTPYDSQSGTDILLEDRINYIYNNDDTQCQSNCHFSYYFIESQYMQCSCLINKDINDNNSQKDKFISKKLYESFYEVLKYSNYNILKCYKIIMNIKIIKNNIGFIISFVFFCCFIICLLIFLFNRINPLKRKLKRDLINLNKQNNININTNTHYLLCSILESNSSKKLTIKLDKSKINKVYNKKNGLNIKKTFGNKKKISLNSNSKRNSSKKSKLNKLTSSQRKIHKKNKTKKVQNTKNIKYSDYELNGMEYEKAIKSDKRSLFQIYISMLKREHLIIFTFCNCKDYNLLSVKLSRFIFLIVGDMALNTFFFSDESLHKLFLNYGKYNFVQEIPQIIYSTIISSIIEIFLCFSSITDKYFYSLKSYFMRGEKNKVIKTLKCINIKLIIFYIFIFIFYIIYWYIISVFCGVYRNTQITFIKDSILSLSLGLLYPLILYFISACFRVCSLKNKKNRLKCLYKLSNMFPFF